MEVVDYDSLALCEILGFHDNSNLDFILPGCAPYILLFSEASFRAMAVVSSLTEGRLWMFN
jgi:hypothetical protein